MGLARHLAYSLCKTTRGFAAAAVLFGLSTPLAAQDLNLFDRLSNSISGLRGDIEDIWPEGLKMEGVKLRVGLAAGFVPDYLGSDNYRLRLLPLVDVRISDRWRIASNKLRYAAIKNGRFEAGPQLTLSFGRHESSNAVLEGLGDVDTVFMGGAYARFRSKSYQLGLDFRHALSDNQGWWLEAYSHKAVYRRNAFVLAVGAKARYFSRSAAQTQFGITARQAQSSVAGLPEFRASPGVDEVDGQVLGIWHLGEKTRFISLLSVGRLLGDAADSPIVRGKGSPNQIVAGFGLFFLF